MGVDEPDPTSPLLQGRVSWRLLLPNRSCRPASADGSRSCPLWANRHRSLRRPVSLEQSDQAIMEWTPARSSSVLGEGCAPAMRDMPGERTQLSSTSKRHSKHPLSRKNATSTAT